MMGPYPAFAGDVATASHGIGQVDLPIESLPHRTWGAGVKCFIGGDGTFEVFASGDDEIIIRRK